MNTSLEINTEREESFLPEVSTPPAVSIVTEERPPLDEISVLFRHL